MDKGKTDAALSQYRKGEAAAWAECEKTKSGALRELEIAVACANEKYKRVDALLWAEYRKANDAARVASENAGATENKTDASPGETFAIWLERHIIDQEGHINYDTVASQVDSLVAHGVLQ